MLHRSRLSLTLVLAAVAGNVQAFGLADTATTLTVTSGVTLPGSGTDNVAAVYSGDTNFAASTSDTVLVRPGLPTSTTLTVTPTTGELGTDFTLTATVVNSAAAKVTAGSVDFFSNGALLSNVQLEGTTGVAAFSTRSLPLGTDSITATFVGTESNQPSTSNAVSLPVTGKNATAVALTSSVTRGKYTLTAHVHGFGFGGPTGSVVFTDNSTGTTLGTVPLTGAELTSTFTLASSTVTADDGTGDNCSFAAGDFNGDGLPDLVVADCALSSVSVYLSNGDGTFQAPITQYGVPVNSYAGQGHVVVGDFNGDGKLDLAIGGMALLVLLGNGDGSFQSPQSYAISSGGSVAAGDFNGDGKPDLAVPNTNNYTVSIFLGNGDGSFQPAQLYTVGYGAFGVAVGDFNRDGKVDLAVVNESDATVSILLGNGDGSFESHGTYAIGGYPIDIAVGDFRGDGKLDLAVVNSYGSVSILLGNGNGTFAAQQTYPIGGGASYIVLGDVNGDGKLDLLTANTFDGDVSVLLGNGNGTFQNQQIYDVYVGPLVGGMPSVVPWQAVFADFNHDGRLDIASVNEGNSPEPSNLTVLLGSAAGAGVSLTGVTLPGSGTDNVTASYTGDALFSASTSNPLLLRSNPAGATITTLSASPKVTVRGRLVSLTATVVDSKGEPVIAGGSVSFYNGTTLLSTVEITTVSNGSSKAGTATYPTRALPVGTSSLTATFNGTEIDGPNTSAPRTVTITGKYPTATSISATETGGTYTFTGTVTADAPFLPTGDVKFVDTTAHITLGSATLSAASSGFNFAAGARPASGTYPSSVVLADVNNDGKLDLVVGNFGELKLNNYQAGPTFTVYLGNGDGTYAAGNNVGADFNGVSGIAVGDFNHDGKLDVAIAYGDTPSEPPMIGIFPGNGDGSFGEETDYPANAGSSVFGINTSSITAGDFNHDGNLDLVMAESAGSSDSDATGIVSVLLGNGDGTFQAPQSFAFGSEPFAFGGGTPPAVAVGDFNGDGRLDLAVASSGGNNYLAILLGNGDGTFKTASSYGTGLATNAIAVADLDGDGKLDVVVATPEDTLTVWQGNGDGTLRPGARVPAGPNSVSVGIGDLNGDGIPDLAVSYQGSNAVGLYVGNGDGTFQAPTTVRLDNPAALALGDVNNDGRLDIAAVGSAANSIAIFLNKLTLSATLAGVGVPGTGTQSIVATYPGDASFDTSTSKAVAISKPAH